MGSTLRPVEYEDMEYWNKRYSKEAKTGSGGFEWYPGHEAAILEAVRRHCKAGAALEIGCGSSQLALLVSQQGFHPVLATDLSQVVVEQCQQRFAGHDGLEFRVMDCCALDSADAAWDLVLDKGTLDAVDCGGATSTVLQEVVRVLKQAGWYILVSCRDPAWRRAALDAHLHVADIQELRGPGNVSSPCPDAYIYCLQKR
ncbi:hypothetical protein WJX72_011375 [[Myrmecia] bisecta]|uniref:Methyltransferase type 11 domain-containing protein n=1 Tax=[Myrmecia] bisecta TaxID=41462 RepID=A0AAW1QGM8_9CHLO